MKRLLMLAVLGLIVAVASGCATGNKTRAHLAAPISLVNYRCITTYTMPVEGAASSNALTNGMSMEGGGKLDASLPVK